MRKNILWQFLIVLLTGSLNTKAHAQHFEELRAIFEVLFTTEILSTPYFQCTDGDTVYFVKRDAMMQAFLDSVNYGGDLLTLNHGHKVAINDTGWMFRLDITDYLYIRSVIFDRDACTIKIDFVDFRLYEEKLLKSRAFKFIRIEGGWQIETRE